MTTQTRRSDPEDPLGDYSGVTLFPRTLASVRNASKPYDSDDLLHVHNFLKSMPLQSPNKFLKVAKAIIEPTMDNDKLKDPEELFAAFGKLEKTKIDIQKEMEAKAIAGSSLGISNSGIVSSVVCEDKNEVIAVKVVENRQERRPGLGRRRARFSMKPQYSQSTVSLEPCLDIDKFKDPEELFAAFEKLENAKREIQKQTGVVSIDLNEQNLSRATRSRRPGIPGRRSAKYKHHYLNEISSLETFEENIRSPSQYDVPQEATNMDVTSQEWEANDAELHENELVDSVAKSEKRVNDLLDELLAGNDEDLNEDRAINLLQEQLQIKPIVLDKLCLPDWQDVRRIDLKASGADLTKPRNLLSDIQNLLLGMSSKTPKKRKLAERSVPCLASPTPPKSPLRSIISLKNLIFQSNPLNDPFSVLNVDQSPARNASPFGSIEKQTEEVNMGKERSISPNLRSPMIEENGTADVNTSLAEEAIGDVIHSSDKTANDNLSRVCSGVDVGSSGFNDDVEGSIGGSCMDNTVASETLGRPDADTDIQPNEPAEFNDKGEDVLQEALDFVQLNLNMETSTGEKLNNALSQLDQTSHEDHAMDQPSKLAESGPEQQNEEVQISTSESVNEQKKASSCPRRKGKCDEEASRRQSLADQTSHDVVEDQAMDGPSKTAETGPGQHDEEVQISTREPVTVKRKAISRPHKKAKSEEVSRRKSLAAAGTSWESGVRRSTRIRSRPLEYWKGERFLYGRVHQSLTTVIGIKYESPGNADGKPGLKVKSFVSDQYKDLVELAARF